MDPEGSNLSVYRDEHGHILARAPREMTLLEFLAWLGRQKFPEPPPTKPADLPVSEKAFREVFDSRPPPAQWQPPPAPIAAPEFYEPDPFTTMPATHEGKKRP